MSVPRQKLEVWYLLLGNFEVISFLALFLVMIIGLVGILLCVGRETGDIQAQGKLGDVFVLELLWHHLVLFNVIVCEVRHLSGVRQNTALIRLITNKE